MKNPSTNPRILVVCQVFHPDQQSTSQLLSDVIKCLPRKGHAITVLCGFPGLESQSSLPQTENWNGVTIRRGGLRMGYKRSLWRRALAYLGYSAFVVRQLLMARRGQRVFVVTNPPFAPIAVWLVGIVKPLRFTVMLQDIYPDGLVATHRIKRGGLVEKLWRALNRRAFRAAGEIWVIGRDMRDLVVQNYRVPIDKIRYVPHWSPVEPGEAKDPESTHLWSQLGLHGKFVVQYSGNMGLWHDLETIIRGAALLRDHPRVHFLFIGNGIKRAGAAQLAGELGLANITWLSFMGRDQLTDSLACCHVALISQLQETVGVAVPSKLYGILASGKAVLAQVPAQSEVARVVREENCGIVVLPGDERALADAICVLAEAPDEVKGQGASAFAAYHAKYTVQQSVETFDRLWKNLK
jgi:glycosyltransferase involved in cell wall biosynthesis